MFRSDKSLITLLFLIAFLSTLFFTLGVPFFWEDGQIFHYSPPSLLELLKFSKPDFFYLNYNSRAMTGPLLGWQHFFLGENILNYRLFRAVIYSLLAVACFLLLRRSTSRTTAFWGSFFYIFVPETWFQAVYQDIGLFSHLALVGAFLIFLKTYKLANRVFLRFLSFSIVLILLNFSINTKHEGRYALLIFLPLCLVYQRKAIWRNIWFFLALLFISFPILGLFVKHGQRLVSNDKINLSLNILIVKFFTNFKNPLFTLGILMWSILAVSLLLLIRAGMRKRDILSWLRRPEGEGLVFSFFWFLSALIFNFLIECWDYPPRGFQKGYYMYLWMPFLVFVFTLAHGAYQYAQRKKIFLTVLIVFCLISFVFNVDNLNKNRGAWGGYWIGMGNLRKFVNENSKHALLLLPPMHFHKGVYFYDSDNQVDLNPLYTDISALQDLYKSGKFESIYVSDRKPLDFKANSQVVLVAKAMNTSNGPYDAFKTIFGKKPKPVFYIYHYSP